MPSKNSKSTKTTKNSAKTTAKSPYATSFNNNIKKGTPFSVVIASIAKRTGKAPSVICNSLVKAGLCHHQKFNGQWIYWPCEMFRTNATNAKVCQNNMWQWFIDWCITSKCCTPDQLADHCGSQKAFMEWCRKYINRQFVASGAGKSTARKSSVSKSRKTSTTSTRSYKFPTTRSKTTTRRVRRAA